MTISLSEVLNKFNLDYNRHRWKQLCAWNSEEISWGENRPSDSTIITGAIPILSAKEHDITFCDKSLIEHARKQIGKSKSNIIICYSHVASCCELPNEFPNKVLLYIDDEYELDDPTHIFTSVMSRFFV